MASENDLHSDEQHPSRDVPASPSSVMPSEIGPSSAYETSDSSNLSVNPASSFVEKEKTHMTESAEAFPRGQVQVQLQHKGEPDAHKESENTKHAHFSVTHEVDGERLGASPRSPSPKRTSRKSPRSITTAGQSFFETSSESEGDDTIVARASSVRVSRPSMVQHSPSVHGRAAKIHAISSRNITYSTTPLRDHVSESSETTIAADGQEQYEEESGGPGDALKLLQGTVATDTVALGSKGQADRLALMGGLRMNPVTSNDKVGINRATSAPSLRHKDSSRRRVTIRPSDLVITRPKDSAHPFRETIVMTPYPALDENEETDAEKQSEQASIAVDQPRRSDTLKSTRVSGDRFPSPDQPEILFLDLGLARHPEVTMTLEVRITDKSAYDDEMLFQQIRAAYRNRLLGTSRRPFCLIRNVTHATVSASVRQDFRISEFVKHFHNPRIGRRRKSWVIWLRHHSWQQQQQLPPNETDDIGTVKQPLSASIRSADRRLSAQSDSTSVFSFPFLPQFLLPRLPFLNKGTVSPSSAATYHSPLELDDESTNNVIRINLHHDFSFWILALFFLWTVFLSIAAVILWIVFGVPGLKPGDRQARVAVWSFLHTTGSSWRTDAEDRVLTGLVLGLLVAVIGSMVDLCLVAGAYILL